MSMAHPEQKLDPHECDLLVIGGGPGGYTAAFRAADLGASVIMVDTRTELGGVCLNEGCIPSKALLHVTKEIRSWQRMHSQGIVHNQPAYDLDAIRTHVDATIKGLNKGLKSLASRRKITLLQGRATLTSRKTARVEDSEGNAQAISFAKAILATGSQALAPEGLEPGHPKVWTAAEALQIPVVPESLLVVGGGIIGLEMATVYATLGSTVTVLEMAPSVLPQLDSRLRRLWERENREISIHTDIRIDKYTVDQSGVSVQVGDTSYQAAYLLVATGRTPAPPPGLAETGIQLSTTGTISVNQHMQSSVPNLYAIGDLTGGPMLAHRASHQGKVAAEHACGDPLATWDHRVIPAVAYTLPEVAWVGQIESDEEIASSDFPWAANGKALASNASGLTRVFYRTDTRQVVGGLIVGDHAGDLLQEIVLAIEMGAELEDIAGAIHPHPTLVETIGNAAEAGLGTITEL